MYQTQNTITQLVEQMLPRASSSNRFLYVKVAHQVSLYCGEDDPAEMEDYEMRVQLNLLFHRPTNYTQVWQNITDGFHHDLTSPTIGWESVSNHDSCWSTDGLRGINSTLNSLKCHIINAVCVDMKISEEFARSKYWNRISVSTTIGDYGRLSEMYSGMLADDTVRLKGLLLEDTIVRFSGAFKKAEVYSFRSGHTVVVMRGAEVDIKGEDGYNRIITTSSAKRVVMGVVDGEDDKDGNPIKNPMIVWDDQGTICQTDINNVRNV